MDRAINFSENSFCILTAIFLVIVSFAFPISGQNDIVLNFEQQNDICSFDKLVNYNYGKPGNSNAYGGYALGLGPISPSSSSFIEASVCGGPGTIKFNWSKQSSVADLSFYVDGVRVDYCKREGITEMRHSGPHPLLDPTKDHKLIWSYQFNNVAENNIINSHAWIDDIQLENLHFCNYNLENNADRVISQENNFSEICSILRTSSNQLTISQGTNLQMVLDAAKFVENSQPGFNKTFFLDAGNYDGNIIIRAKNICISGSIDNLNPGKAKLDGKWGEYNILLENTSNVSIIGLDLTKSLKGIQIENSAGCNVRGNSIRVYNRNGDCSVSLLLWNCSQCEISNNILQSFDSSACISSKGIWLISSFENVFEDNNQEDFNYSYYLQDVNCENSSRKNKIFDCRDSACQQRVWDGGNCTDWWHYE